MPYANWKGTISFGLVSIPIVLINSENKAAQISFHQIDTRDQARIKYERVNANTGKMVPWEKIGKAYEYEKDNLLVVEEDELSKVVGENSRTIAIEEFVDAKDLDFVHINKTYYLQPDKKGEKGYAILRQALKEAGKIAIAKVIISTKEYVAAIGLYQKALVLYLLRYEEEIKDIGELKVPALDDKNLKISAKEISVAKQLIKAMSAKWQPEKFKNEYQEAVHAWAEAKVKKKKFVKMKARASKATGKSVSFVELLKQSMKKSSSSKRAHLH